MWASLDIKDGPSAGDRSRIISHIAVFKSLNHPDTFGSHTPWGVSSPIIDIQQAISQLQRVLIEMVGIYYFYPHSILSCFIWQWHMLFFWQTYHSVPYDLGDTVSVTCLFSALVSGHVTQTWTVWDTVPEILVLSKRLWHKHGTWPLIQFTGGALKRGLTDPLILLSRPCKSSWFLLPLVLANQFLWFHQQLHITAMNMILKLTKMVATKKS